MKPIEEGCLAVVIAGHGNIGKVVTCLKKIGTMEGLQEGHCWWELDKKIALQNNITYEIVYKSYYPEHAMMRIDGYEDEQTATISESHKDCIPSA